MKTKQYPQQYRQGDVLIERVQRLPKNLTPQSPENGRVILAHGEVTGHAHAFEASAAAKFIAKDGAEYFAIKGPKIEVELPILRRWHGQVMVRHPQYGPLEFAEADIEITGETARIAGEFGLLRHDEHGTHAIPAGLYRGGSASGNVRQREYSPLEIRNVAD